MYVPPEFEITDPKVIIQFLAENSFALLSAVNSGGNIISAHLPFVLHQVQEQRFFFTHIANENELSRLIDGQEVQLIFQGSHGYISSSWYGHPNVPTWNYMAVHIYGKAIKQTREQLHDHLKELTSLHELTVNGHIHPDNLPQQLIDGYLNHITGFRIEENSFQAAFKLSQNRNQNDFESIIKKLKESNPELAYQMELFYSR